MANVSIAARTNTSCSAVNNWITSLSISFFAPCFPLMSHVSSLVTLSYFCTASLIHHSFMLSKDLHFTDGRKPPYILFHPWLRSAGAGTGACTPSFTCALRQRRTYTSWCVFLWFNMIVLTFFFAFFMQEGSGNTPKTRLCVVIKRSRYVLQG